MRRLTYERRIQLLALAAGLPGSFIALILLWNGSYSSRAAWTLTFLILSLWLGFALSLRHRVVFSLQTLSNLLSAMREEDFSFRAREARSDDALGEVMLEVNSLSETLRSQRLGAMEATGLLRTVMEEIDVAIFTFDNDRQLRLVNRAGERLLSRSSERLLGFTAAELGLAACLEEEPVRTMELSFPGGSGRWGMRRGSFRQGGLPHDLIVLSDLSRALRDEERQAWQRLIRVLGHELNNSLAPIKSIAGTLNSLTSRAGLPEDIHKDVQQGLQVIENRVESLGRFMQAYTQLARMPAPTKGRITVGTLVYRAAALERRLSVSVLDGPKIEIDADLDQLEQLLINVIRNAVDATLDLSREQPGKVEVGWRVGPYTVEIFVLDEGPGLLNSDNLFVPFFTTKHGGSGIGLILSRQIAEAHGGTLQLANRKDRAGAEATLSLPLIVDFKQAAYEGVS